MARAERLAIEAALGEETAVLRRQVETLVDAIAVAHSRCQRLRTQTDANLGRDGSRGTTEGGGSSITIAPVPGSAGGAGSTAVSGVDPLLLGQLAQAYAAAGFSADASLTPLAMLAQVGVGRWDSGSAPV